MQKKKKNNNNNNNTICWYEHSRIVYNYARVRQISRRTPSEIYKLIIRYAYGNWEIQFLFFFFFHAFFVSDCKPQVRPGANGSATIQRVSKQNLRLRTYISKVVSSNRTEFDNFKKIKKNIVFVRRLRLAVGFRFVQSFFLHCYGQTLS